MKTIGLIGGMSWESTSVYYRLINEAMRARLGNLHSANILMHSLDFESVVVLQKANEWPEAGALLGRSAATLAAAGADCVLICTNTMHLVADIVAGHCRVPVIHIIDETAREIARAHCKRPLLLATRYTMEHGFYAERMKLAQGIEVQVPNAADRASVHAIIFDELCRGVVLDTSRALLMEIIQRGMDAGADSIILGCTEICLILNPDQMPFKVFDSTAIHARAAVDFALAPPHAATVSKSGPVSAAA